MPEDAVKVLNRLLEGLQTENGKAHVIYNAFEKGILDEKNPEHVEIAIQQYEKAGWIGAGYWAEQKGEYERAVALYEKSGNFIEASKMAYKVGNQEHALALLRRGLNEGVRGPREYDPKSIIESGEEFVDLAIRICEEEGLYDAALELAKKIKREEKVRELTPKVRESYENILNAFLKEGMPNEAIEFLSEQGDEFLSEQGGLEGELAVKWFQKLGQFYSAARIAKEKGLIDLAIQLHIEGADVEDSEWHYSNAAELLLSRGDIRQAMLFYEKAGNFEKAKELAIDLEDGKIAKAYKDTIKLLKPEEEN